MSATFLPMTPTRRRLFVLVIQKATSSMATSVVHALVTIKQANAARWVNSKYADCTSAYMQSLECCINDETKSQVQSGELHYNA